MSVPYWLEEPFSPYPRRPLKDVAEVEIVGGGVTGLSCALTLAEAGVRVCVHEAREVASGASGRNGGFALRGGSMAYPEAVAALGRERAGALWSFTEAGLAEIERLAGDAFRPTGSLRVAADEAELIELQQEFAELQADGFGVQWVDELPAQLSSFSGAFRHTPDGALQPASWVRRLGARAAAAGASILELSRVETLESLDAPTVVLATDGYTSRLLPALDALVGPVRNQVVVTEPLQDVLFPCPHYARRGFDYWQQLPGGRLVVGGRRDADPTAELTSEEALSAKIQGSLEGLVEQLLGYVPPITHRWAGIFGSSPDGLPFVGPVSNHQGLWVAAGYAGHGNVLGFLCGQLVARAILGESSPELALFDSRRAL